MKKFFPLCLLMIMSISVFAKQADIFTVKGTLKNKDNAEVMYANVVLLTKTDKSVANGGVSNEDGKFSLSVPAGDYTLSVSFMGYKTVNKDISVKSNMDMGVMKMETDATVLSDVTITAKMTERKGDRLVVNLASSPLVEGKTTKDILNYTPGVWLDNKGELSINGKKNVRVMINDRDVKMSGEELLTYLESLQASDILKIEVIPMAGAEYEADSAGGVIHVTLKKKALEGLNGTMGVNYNQREYWGVSPWIKTSFRKDRLSINAQYNYNNSMHTNEIEEVSDYFTTQTHQNSHSFTKSKNLNHYANVDVVYDITPKSEVGVAVEFNNSHSYAQVSKGFTRQVSPEGGVDVTSGMKDINNNNRVNVTTYYKIKTDEKGSSFKVVGDYTYNNTKGYNFSSALYDYDDGNTMSNIYDYSAPTTVDLFSVRADYNHQSDGKITWSTGAKYSNSHIASQANYRTYDGLAWNENDPRNNVFSYNEQVTAAYGKMNISLPKGWSAVSGLRMEYTQLSSYSLTMEQKDTQDYFDFFPQVSLMKTFGENKLHSISANYTRRLSRPSYSIFNPFVTPINEFSSAVGNPDIRPSYINRYSISGVLYGKYSISAEYDMKSGSVAQVTLIDPDSDNKTIYKEINMGNAYSWSLSASAPITITKWYGMNLSGTTVYSEDAMDDYTYYQFVAQGSMQNNFTFGKGWSVDVSGWFTSLLRQGNLTVDPMWTVNASVVKKCMNNRLVFSLNVIDVFDSLKNNIYSSGAQFDKKTISRWDAQTVKLGVRWNFAQGKNSKTKKVESGNSEDRNRL